MSQTHPRRVLQPQTIRVPSSSLPFSIALVVTVISFAFGTYWLSALGVGAFAYFMTRLLNETGVDLPIENFIGVSYSNFVNVPLISCSILVWVIIFNILAS